MQLNPECKPYFHDWETIANFEAEGDTWTAPSDGYLNIYISDMSTSVEYCYIREGSNPVPIGSIVLPTGANGGTFTTTFPVRKGKSYAIASNITTMYRFMAFDI